jgi:hypothetical protein
MVPSAGAVFHVKHFASSHRVDKRGKEAQRRGDGGADEQWAFSEVVFFAQ